MNIIILGPPGSGKGTQAEKLAKKFSLFYFSSGTLTRELSKNNPRIRAIMEKGGLIPSKEMSEYVLSYLGKNSPQADNIIFDGYPRLVDQYDLLKKWVEGKGKKIDLAIFLEVSEAQVIKRISSRKMCAQCGEIYNLATNLPSGEVCDKCGGKLIRRKDDSPESVKERLFLYKSSIEKVIKKLDEDKLLQRVDGDREINEIQKDLVKLLESHERN